MKLPLQISLCSIVIVFLAPYVLAKKDDLIPCPPEDTVVCVDCTCSPEDGKNTCRQREAGCPPPITSVSQIKGRSLDKKSKCIHGQTFVAQCALCDCLGEGKGDHCGMCHALPVRNIAQTREINKKLPQPTDNRFFNYEIVGWGLREDEE